MKKLMITLTILNLLMFVASCSQEVKADNDYELRDLFGYECITNYKSIWCR